MRRLGLYGAVGAVGALLLWLSWRDVLPGGYMLRGWVKPHAERSRERRAAHAQARLSLFASENQAVPAGAVVFLGSSTIERFDLEAAFPQAACVNRGIGHETAQELVGRLDASWPARTPAAAVLYLGSNDLRRDNAAPAEVTTRAAAVLRAVRARFPALPLAVIGILPDQRMPGPRRLRLEAANRSLALLAAQFDAAFVPTDRPPLRDENGRLAASFAADALHLNDAGYAVLRGWLLAEGGAVAPLLAGPSKQNEPR